MTGKAETVERRCGVEPSDLHCREPGDEVKQDGDETPDDMGVRVSPEGQGPFRSRLRHQPDLACATPDPVFLAAL